LKFILPQEFESKNEQSPSFKVLFD